MSINMNFSYLNAHLQENLNVNVSSTRALTHRFRKGKQRARGQSNLQHDTLRLKRAKKQTCYPLKRKKSANPSARKKLLVSFRHNVRLEHKDIH